MGGMPFMPPMMGGFAMGGGFGPGIGIPPPGPPGLNPFDNGFPIPNMPQPPQVPLPPSHTAPTFGGRGAPPDWAMDPMEHVNEYMERQNLQTEAQHGLNQHHAATHDARNRDLDTRLEEQIRQVEEKRRRLNYPEEDYTIRR